MPCNDAGLKLPAHHDAAHEGVPARPRMPPGYVTADTDPSTTRDKYTPDDTVTPEGTWCGDAVLKWSGCEILKRSDAAAEIMSQVLSLVPWTPTWCYFA